MDLAAYGLSVDGVARLPGGYTADCYRVRSGASDYLVKVWRPERMVNPHTLGLPGTLRDAGLPVVAPIPTASGELSTSTGRGTVAVFPFVDGVAAPGWSSWTDELLHRFGAMLARVHRVDVSGLGHLPHDRLAVLPDPPAVSYPGLDRYREELAEQHRRLAAIRPSVGPLVLCHTDLAGDNLLITESGGLIALDWDEAVIGPAELDFMLLAEPDARPFAKVLEGYGDAAALSLRRLEFCMLRRYLADASVRLARIADPGATADERAGAFADFQRWGVARWRRLDSALAAVAKLIGA